MPTADAQPVELPLLSALLDAVLSAPRHRTLDTLSREINPLLAHSSAVMLTGACARAPIKTSGEIVAFTPTALLAVTDQARHGGGFWTGDADIDGRTRNVTVVYADAALAGGAALVLLHASPVDPQPHLRTYLTELWNLVTIALGDRATNAEPSLASSSAHATRDRAALLARAHEQQSSLLRAFLAALRSTRLDDPTARRVATQIASDALIQHRHDTDIDTALVTEPAKAAWDTTMTFLHSLLTHGDIDFEHDYTGENPTLDLDIAHLATSLTRAVVALMTDDPNVTRIKLRWHVTASELRITLRDNGSGKWPSHDTADLDAQLGPYQSQVDIDSNQGWGTTVAATIPLAVSIRPSGDATIGGLTDQELAVLTDVSAGMRNRDIAAHLAISEHTVKFHVRKLLQKFSTSTRGELAAKTHRLGI